MSKAQINIKELEFISDDGMSWLDDPTAGNMGKALVFPTPKAFLDAVVENGQAKTEHTEYMKNYASDLKECIEILGNMKTVVEFIHSETGNTSQEQRNVLPDISCIMFSFVEYCAVSGLHYDEVTDYMIDELFADTRYSKIPDDRLNEFIVVDKDAEEQIWYMSSEYSLGYEILLYKLSAEEQELLKQQMEELDGKPCQSELYVKAYSLVLEEILQLFNE